MVKSLLSDSWKVEFFVATRSSVVCVFHTGTVFIRDRGPQGASSFLRAELTAALNCQRARANARMGMSARPQHYSCSSKYPPPPAPRCRLLPCASMQLLRAAREANGRCGNAAFGDHPLPVTSNSWLGCILSLGVVPAASALSPRRDRGWPAGPSSRDRLAHRRAPPQDARQSMHARVTPSACR